VTAHEKPWIEVGAVDEIPLRGSRVLRGALGDIALFRAADGRVFALEDRCPHKGGPLSQGIVHDHAVTCPLHNWVIALDTGMARGPDQGCARVIPLKVAEGRVYVAVSALMPQPG
jgi:nitrite reductase (NADH) small subunit